MTDADKIKKLTEENKSLKKLVKGYKETEYRIHSLLYTKGAPHGTLEYKVKFMLDLF